MAIVPTVLLHAGSSSANTARTTGAFDVLAGTSLLIAVSAFRDNNNTAYTYDLPVPSQSVLGTVTPIANEFVTASGNDRYMMQTWWAPVTGSNNITVDFTASTTVDDWLWAIVQIAGGNNSALVPSAQYATHKITSGSALSATLPSTPAADSLTFGFFRRFGFSSLTPGTDFTRLGTGATIGSGSSDMEYWTGAGSPDQVIDGTFAQPAILIGVEVQAASGQPYAKRLGGVPFMALNRGVW